MRKWWLIGSGMLVGAVMLAGGVIWYLRTHDTAPDVTQPTSEQRTPMPIGGSGTDTAASPDPDALAVKDGSETGQVGGAQAAPTEGSANASRVPEPAEFRVYEQYKDAQTAMFTDLREGDGAEAHSGSTVKMNYRGWLSSGQLFDDSYRRGQSFEFQMGAGRVITGWEQGIAGMKVGGKRRLIVPPGVGYGAEGRDPIPGNALLVFDVELVEVK